MTRQSNESKACLCGCGANVKRVKSLALCKVAAIRARSAFRASAHGMRPNDYIRAFNAFYGDPNAVAAALSA